MATTEATLGVNTSFDPETGRLVEVAPGIGRVTAPNRGPYTFTGTNTFLVGHDRLLVIDPGPDDGQHLEALLSAIRDRPVEAILLTHTHRDHSGLARSLRRHLKAPLCFAGPHRLYRELNWLERRRWSRACDFGLSPDTLLKDGDTLSVDGMGLTAVATPGHCANHLAFSVSATPYLFSGDHVMGWSSTLVAPPDGAMGDYLQSLDRVIVSPFSHYLPAHGGAIPEGRKYARSLLAHRQARDRQILEGLAEGADTVDRLVGRIYKDLSPALRTAAGKTIEAHLERLVSLGEVAEQRSPFRARYVRVPEVSQDAQSGA